MSDYVAKSLIVHPRPFVCHENHILHNCPPDLLAQFIRDDIVKLVGEGGPPESLIPDHDILSGYSRSELILVMKLNELQKLIHAKQNWSDEQIRQGIRNVWPDLSTLKVPNETNIGEVSQ